MRKYNSRRAGISFDPYVSSKAIEYIAKFIVSKHAYEIDPTKENALSEFIFLYISEDEFKLLLIKSGYSPDNTRFSNPSKFLEKCFIGTNDSKFKILVTNISNLLLSKSEEKSNQNEESFFFPRLNDLVNTFSLDNMEKELLILIYLFQECEAFKWILREFESPQGMIHLMKIILPENTDKTIKAMDRIKKVGIVDDYGTIEMPISNFLTGTSEGSLCSRFYTVYEKETLPVEYFDAMKDHIETLKSLIQNKADDEGINILLYGCPGTGKSEFIKMLSKLLNYKLFEINNSEESAEDKNYTTFRFLAFRACQSRSNPKNSVILVDECDEMLNGVRQYFTTRNTTKNIINSALDESKHISIWITNYSDSIDESTKRRFDYSIEFSRLSRKAREKIFTNTLIKYGLDNLFSQEDTKYLADKYETNAGNIDTAVRNFKKIKTEQEPLDAIEAIFKTHLKIMDIKFNPLSKNNRYSLDGLNIKGEMSIKDIVSIIKSFSKQLDTSANWAVKNMNLLLYGPSGTGKSEFAKFISRELDKELLVKRASDLLDMYVGGTEKNIRNSFREAEAENSILFIDEFDGLISSRENAVRSWEVSQVNELLVQIEEFKGILICATNFKERIDSAATRRFNLKLEFDYLDDNGKILFYNLLLNDLVHNDNKVDLIELNSVGYLTPGDYKVVSQKYSFLPKDKITHRNLIESLRAESESKNNVRAKRIGY